MSYVPKNFECFKVAARVCRIGNRLSYAFVKVNCKQITRSLKTIELAIAKRRLVKFCAKAERLEGGENRNFRFEELADGGATLKLIALKAGCSQAGAATKKADNSPNALQW